MRSCADLDRVRRRTKAVKPEATITTSIAEHQGLDLLL
jgi:hypothetical protein